METNNYADRNGFVRNNKVKPEIDIPKCDLNNYL